MWFAKKKRERTLGRLLVRSRVDAPADLWGICDEISFLQLDPRDSFPRGYLSEGKADASGIDLLRRHRKQKHNDLRRGNEALGIANPRERELH